MGVEVYLRIHALFLSDPFAGQGWHLAVVQLLSHDKLQAVVRRQLVADVQVVAHDEYYRRRQTHHLYACPLTCCAACILEGRGSATNAWGRAVQLKGGLSFRLERQKII